MELSRATSRGDPEFGVVCVQEQREHMLDWLGVVFYRGEAKEGQEGQSKGYWPGSKRKIRQWFRLEGLEL